MKNNSITDFERFQDLFITIKTTKKFDIELEKAALEWFKLNFKAPFGTLSRCDQKHLPFLWHYSAGMLIFCVNGLGSYFYKSIIMQVMFSKLNIPSYKAGFAYVRKQKAVDANYTIDDNPYPKANFYDHKAWDLGFIAGLYNYKF